MRVMQISEDTKFIPSDFYNKRYRCVNCYNQKDKTPVLMLASNKSNPPHWMVIDGTKQMVYLSYGEAMQYCVENGYVKP